MICSDGASVLHVAPLRPRHDRVLRWVPDLLTPDDVLEIERGAIVHGPFRDRFSNRGADLTGFPRGGGNGQPDHTQLWETRQE